MLCRGSYCTTTVCVTYTLTNMWSSSTSLHRDTLHTLAILGYLHDGDISLKPVLYEWWVCRWWLNVVAQELGIRLLEYYLIGSLWLQPCIQLNNLSAAIATAGERWAVLPACAMHVTHSNDQSEVSILLFKHSEGRGYDGWAFRTMHLPAIGHSGRQSHSNTALIGRSGLFPIL